MSKAYTIKKEYGRFSITMNEKGADGKIHSASCSYPFYNESYDLNGKLVRTRLNQKQTEAFLLQKIKATY